MGGFGTARLLAAATALSIPLLFPGAFAQEAEKDQGTKRLPSPLEKKDSLEYSGKNPADFSWDMFLWLNQAARGNLPGMPHQPSVWETWVNAADIYLPDGSEPAPWPKPSPQAPYSQSGFGGLSGIRHDAVQVLDEDRMVDGQHIESIWGDIIYYSVVVSKKYHDYVTAGTKYELYNLDGQVEAARDKFKVQFPRNTIELKPSWMVVEAYGDDGFIRPIDESRYHIGYGRYRDAGGKLRFAKLALTGLHIIVRNNPEPPYWFWITFEHVDNPTKTFAIDATEGERGTREQVGAPLDFTPGAEAANQRYQGRIPPRGVKGTKWANYQLIGWQDSFEENGQPTVLANTQIETYFQKTSSCITCHNMSNIGHGKVRRAPMWETRWKSPTNAPVHGIRGRVGKLERLEFEKILKEDFNLDPAEFIQLDYVWSLRRAKPKRVPRTKP